MNNHFLTDYSLLFWYTLYVFFYEGVPCDIFLPFEEWRLRLFTEDPSGESISSVSISLPPPNWLVSLTQSSWCKMWVCLMLPGTLGGAAMFQWTSLISDSIENSLLLIWIPQYMLKGSIVCFPFCFLYKPSTCLLLNCFSLYFQRNHNL